jgi:class 3 adenylate cyclase
MGAIARRPNDVLARQRPHPSPPPEGRERSQARRSSHGSQQAAANARLPPYSGFRLTVGLKRDSSLSTPIAVSPPSTGADGLAAAPEAPTPPPARGAASLAPAGMHRLTLHFTDAALEARYRQAEDGNSIRSMRIACLAGIALFLLTGVVLHFAPRELLGQVDVWRSVLTTSALILCAYGVTFSAPVLRRPQATIVLYSILFAWGMALAMRRAPLDFAINRGHMFLVMHIITVCCVLELRVVPATIAAACSVGAYVLAVVLDGLIPDAAVSRQSFWLTAVTVWSLWICHQLDLRKRREYLAHAALDRERARSEALLLNILPPAIAARLKESQEPIAEHNAEATVLFADIVGFTPLSARLSPRELVDLLDRVFSGFDALAREHGLEKIKTIGDAYMAVAGVPHGQTDHALRAARMAVAMLQAVRQVTLETGERLEVRVGLHSGPVVAGVIGRSKFSYDLWGDTVNTASRMESLGLPGQVQCSPATAACLEGAFALVPRGAIEVKGKGSMETYLLAGAQVASADGEARSAQPA